MGPTVGCVRRIKAGVVYEDSNMEIYIYIYIYSYYYYQQWEIELFCQVRYKLAFQIFAWFGSTFSVWCGCRHWQGCRGCAPIEVRENIIGQYIIGQYGIGCRVVIGQHGMGLRIGRQSVTGRRVYHLSVYHWSVCYVSVYIIGRYVMCQYISLVILV